MAAAPIPHKRLNAARLAAAITQVTNDGAIRRRTTELGAKIRAEGGVAQAVDLINRLPARGVAGSARRLAA